MSAIELLPGERLQAIEAALQAQGRVVAAELAQRFGVSEDSIRRDLRELAQQGKCRRIYGGALLPTLEPTTLDERRQVAPDRKRDIAALAVGLLRPRQVVMIDAGSTNLAIAASLPQELSLTVVTNAPEVAMLAAARNGVEVLLLGGRFERRVGGVLGMQAIEQVRAIRADLCFPGACAVDPGSGVWGMDPEEAALKRAMIAASSATVVAATTEKLGAEATFLVAPVERIDHVLLDGDASDAQAAAFQSLGIRVHRPAPTRA